MSFERDAFRGALHDFEGRDNPRTPEEIDELIGIMEGRGVTFVSLDELYALRGQRQRFDAVIALWRESLSHKKRSRLFGLLR
jgi:hypothetical protein